MHIPIGKLRPNIALYNSSVGELSKSNVGDLSIISLSPPIKLALSRCNLIRLN